MNFFEFQSRNGWTWMCITYEWHQHTARGTLRVCVCVSHQVIWGLKWAWLIWSVYSVHIEFAQLRRRHNYIFGKYPSEVPHRKQSKQMNTFAIYSDDDVSFLLQLIWLVYLWLWWRRRRRRRQCHCGCISFSYYELNMFCFRFSFENGFELCTACVLV